MGKEQKKPEEIEVFEPEIVSADGYSTDESETGSTKKET